jgi:hypothetical protein
MSKNNTKSFDYSIFYLIANLIVFLALYLLSLYFLIINIQSLLMQILLGIMMLPMCAFIEYKVLIRVINPIVEFILPQSYKDKQAENAIKFREANKR